MRLNVDPSRLTEVAGPLRDAAGVAREMAGARDGLAAAEAAGTGSEQLRRATEDFLTAWVGGLTALADTGDRLVRMLDTAAGTYRTAEDRNMRPAGSGLEGR